MQLHKKYSLTIRSKGASSLLYDQVTAPKEWTTEEVKERLTRALNRGGAKYEILSIIGGIDHIFVLEESDEKV